MTADKCRNAVSQCLSGCYTANSPLAALAEYIARLRADPEWTPAEVDRVELKCRRILQTLVGQPESD